MDELSVRSVTDSDHVDSGASDVFDARVPAGEVPEAGGQELAAPQVSASMLTEAPELAPVDGGSRFDAPVAVEAAAPAKERSMKSLVSTITAGVSSVGLTIGTVATMGANWVKSP